MKFEELGLNEPIVRAVTALGYETATPIQQQAIPAVLAGSDVLGCAQTGTGKTGAFALPMLQRLAAAQQSGGRRNRHRNEKRGRLARGLVLCPTRELATQIEQSFREYGHHLAIRPAVIYGGVRQHAQVRQLRAGTDVLVATPGRLLDLIEQGHVDLSAIEMLVLDEADRMLDMGFIRDIQRIIERLPNQRQTLLFSATMPTEIRRLADSLLRNPVVVQSAPTASTVDAITQAVYMVAKTNKPILLGRLLRDRNMKRTLIFTRTKFGADKLVGVLLKSGFRADAIHSNKNQNARARALEGFKSGRTPVLVATDIASRGIDVDEITHVINFDIPNIPETYVHRIGRTARAGATGTAISFCDQDEVRNFRAIERLTNTTVPVADDASDLAFTASPVARRQPDGRRAMPRRTTDDRPKGKRRTRTRRSRRAAA